jgi:TPR repeat protein
MPFRDKDKQQEKIESTVEVIVDSGEALPADEQPKPVASVAETKSETKPAPTKRKNPISMNRSLVGAIVGIAGFLGVLFYFGVEADTPPLFDIDAAQAKIAFADDNEARLLQSTPANDAIALRQIGFDYLVGNKVSVSRAKALSCFDRAAKLGDADAMLYAGLLKHTHRPGKERDESNALIAAAAKAGSPHALEYQITHSVNAGGFADIKSPTISESEAIADVTRRYKILADRGDTDGLWGVLRCGSKDQGYIAILRSNAGNGDVVAQYALGSYLTERSWPYDWSRTRLRSDSLETPAEAPNEDPYNEGVALLYSAAEAGFVPAEETLTRLFDPNHHWNPSIDVHVKAMRGFYFYRCPQTKGNYKDLSIDEVWRRTAMLQKSLNIYGKQASRRGDIYPEAIEQARELTKLGGLSEHNIRSNTVAQASDQKEWVREMFAALDSTPEKFESEFDSLTFDMDCNSGEALSSAASYFETSNPALAKKCMITRAELGDVSYYWDAEHWLEEHGGSKKELAYYQQFSTARNRNGR